MILKDILKNLNIKCDSDIQIDGLNTLKDATNSQVSFLENKKYLNDLKSTNAAAVFVTSDTKEYVPNNCIAIVCENPYINLALASKYFKKEIILSQGNNPIIANKCTIMDNVHLGLNTKIGENTIIMAGSFIGNNVTIGSNTLIYPNVSIYNDCSIGNNVIIHSGTVIGCDGFGFAPTKDGKYIKIYQNGNVEIQDDIEIGSNCTIDRAAFNSTIIKSGVRIDNLVHIAHNCIIGNGCILTGQVGLAGSTILHEYVVMAGQSGATGHLEIAPFSTISGKAAVTKTIKEPNKQWAGFPLMEHKTWLKLQAKIAKLLK